MAVTVVIPIAGEVSGPDADAGADGDDVSLWKIDEMALPAAPNASVIGVQNANSLNMGSFCGAIGVAAEVGTAKQRGRGERKVLNEGSEYGSEEEGGRRVRKRQIASER
jgi:hypothetical protein